VLGGKRVGKRGHDSDARHSEAMEKVTSR